MVAPAGENKTAAQRAAQLRDEINGHDHRYYVLNEPAIPDAETAWHEFGRLTKFGGRSRKEAIAELAERYRLPKRQIYALVEAAKESVE